MRLAALAPLLAVAFFTAWHADGAITIDTVPVGDAGNSNDPAWGNQFGGVAYNYDIGKYDVTVGQYTAFLNAVAVTDTYGLYNPSMATDLNVAGIMQNGSSGNYTYSVIGSSANLPITYVSWGDAARFSNWLSNGQPGLVTPVPQDDHSTEQGSYTLNGATTDIDLAVVRNATATWVIPTESEWYKAAFYDQTLNSGAGGYYANPFSNNAVPTSALPGSTPNTGNFQAATGPNSLTDVGAYTGSASPSGAFDMGGNVWQWNETLSEPVPDLVFRGHRGGSWAENSFYLGSYYQNGIIPTSERDDVGFRVAHVTPSIAGDVNDDHVVNGLDISVIAAHWLLTGATQEQGDANGDGVVNGLDIAIIASHWLYTSPTSGAGNGTASTVPEPTSLALAALGGLALLYIGRLRMR